MTKYEAKEKFVMMTKVNFSCGHTAEVNLANDQQKRKEKIAELEMYGKCPECRKEEFEAKDKLSAKSGVCVRLSKEKYEKEFSDCPLRLTGFPKENDFVYAYIPMVRVCAEALRKMIKNNNIPADEALKLAEAELRKLYPDVFNVLQPLALDDDDDLFADLNTPAEPAEKPAPKKKKAEAEGAEDDINALIDSI